MAAEEHAAAIAEVEARLDRAAEVMRGPSAGGKAELVRDLLRDCAERRKSLEDICMVVIVQEGGEAIFNKIAGELDRLEILQDQFMTWSASVGSASQPAGSYRGSPSGSHEGLGSWRADAGERGGASVSEAEPQLPPQLARQHSEATGALQTVASEAADPNGDAVRKERRRKEKKDLKRSKAPSDATEAFGADGFGVDGFGADGFGTDGFGADGFGVAAPQSMPGDLGSGGAGFGGWPKAGDGEAPAAASSVGASAWSVPKVETSGMGGWPAAGAEGDLSASRKLAAEAGQASLSGVGFDATAGLGGSFVDAWGQPRQPRPASRAGSDASLGGTGMSRRLGGAGNAFGGGGGGGGGRAQEVVHQPSPSVRSRTARSDRRGAAAAGRSEAARKGGSQCASLRICCPFADVKHDLDAFSASFVRAAALAAGVAPSRIRVHGIRPGA